MTEIRAPRTRTLVSAPGGSEERLRARNVRSMMSLETYRALPIPDDLRAAMAPFMSGPGG